MASNLDELAPAGAASGTALQDLGELPRGTSSFLEEWRHRQSPSMRWGGGDGDLAS
jgi:hypothetical protein